MAIRMERKSQGSSLTAGDAVSQLPISNRLANASGLQEIFELVKEVVWRALKVDQAGLMVGLADMGMGPQQVLGAFYSPEANTIVINKAVVERVSRLSDRRLYNSYCFYILLHEYLHSCGFYDEVQNRQIVAAVSANEFGLEHPVTKLSTTADALPKLIRMSMVAGEGQIEAGGPAEGIEFVEGIDRRNTNYIS